MNTYWGVDSATSTNKIVTGNLTLFDYITQEAGQVPQFWGRYIGGAYALTQEEVDFIATQSQGMCKILVVYNGASPASVAGDGQSGANDATQALTAAQSLGIPCNVWIYADIEAGWKVNPAWILGWWETMAASDYANPGGFYCNPLPWNAPNFNDPLYSAWTTAVDPVDSSPLYCPPLYSCQRQMGCSFDLSTFQPAEPPWYPGSAVIWQYALGSLIPQCYNGYVDLDLANDTGYATMWGSTPEQGRA
jgi:Domain of unknown function (DUF1906)